MRVHFQAARGSRQLLTEFMDGAVSRTDVPRASVTDEDMLGREWALQFHPAGSFGDLPALKTQHSFNEEPEMIL